MIINTNDILFRCSSLGYLLTEGKEKSNLEKYIEAKAASIKYTTEYNALQNKATKTAAALHQRILNKNTEVLTLEKSKNDFTPSETCRKQLIRVYAQCRGRYEELKNKYLDKGNARENDAITLLSLVLKKFYKKNKERKYNEFIQGEWDLHEEVEGIIKETLDTKCSWSYITFLESKESELNPIYDYQGQGYMWLTGAEKHTVCYCLVNGTFKYIIDKIRALAWKFSILDGDISDDPDFIKAVQQLERNHIFDIDAFMKECRQEGHDFQPKNDVWYDEEKDKFFWNYDIAREDRIHTKVFYRDEEKINKIKNGVINWRGYLNRKFFKIPELCS